MKFNQFLCASFLIVSGLYLHEASAQPPQRGKSQQVVAKHVIAKKVQKQEKHAKKHVGKKITKNTQKKMLKKADKNADKKANRQIASENRKHMRSELRAKAKKTRAMKHSGSPRSASR